MSRIVEPLISINGVVLSVGQAMTVRVAIESFAGELAAPNALGMGSSGMVMRSSYLQRIDELRDLMLQPSDTKGSKA